MRDPAIFGTYFFLLLKKGIRLPLTVKMRTGWNENELTIHECVKAAYQSQVANGWLYMGEPVRRVMKERQTGISLPKLKSRAQLPIIGNGDIRSADQAKTKIAWKREWMR